MENKAVIKYKKILGLPIFALEEEKFVGKANDIFLNLKNDTAMLICCGSNTKKNNISI